MVNCVGGLLQKRGKTVIMVTHHVQWLHLFDRVLIMEGGKIVTQGAPKDRKILECARSASSVSDDAEEKEEEEAAMNGGGATEVVLTVEEELKDKKQENELLKNEVAKLKEELKVASGKKQDGKLIKLEDREKGKVKDDVWMLYVRAFGLGRFAFLVLLYLISQGGIIGSSGWLSYWSKNSTANPKQHPPGFYIGVYAALSLGGALFIYLRSLLIAFSTVNTGRKLHKKALSAVVHSPCSFFDTTPLGRIINRFSNDLQTIDVTLRYTVSSLFLCVFNLAGTIIVVVSATPYVAAVLVPMAWVYYWTAYYYRHSSRELQRLDSISKSPIYESFAESLTGIPTIRAFGSTKRFEMANSKRVDHNLRAAFISYAANRWLAVRLELIGNFLVFFAAFFAIYEHKGGHISAGVAGLSLSYSLTFTDYLNWLIRVFTTAETNMVNVERLHSFQLLPAEDATVAVPLTASSSITGGADSPPSSPGGSISKSAALAAPKPAKIAADWPAKGSIVFTNVCLRYRPGLPLVLKGVNCTLSPGESVGIVGRTGAGKSSMLVAIFRMVELDSGAITIDGVNIGSIDIHLLRSRLAIIPQDPTLFSGSLRSNMDPFDDYSDEQIWAVLEDCSLAAFVREKPEQLEMILEAEGGNLSVGQRQLACLGRALLCATTVLVLDEATASIDHDTEELLQVRQQCIRSCFHSSLCTHPSHRLP
jgi:ABC-type multidrug transport system fused ATPase/permease subunit